jgi:hypothetical protein
MDMGGAQEAASQTFRAYQAPAMLILAGIGGFQEVNLRNF